MSSTADLATNTDSGMLAGGSDATTPVVPVPDVAPSANVNAATTSSTMDNHSVSFAQSEQQDASRQYRSKVNGLGMWSAWERNFSNKLKACLDLVDNAVDAALWDSDDEEEVEEENEGKPLSVRERWKKQSGEINISTEKHRLAIGDYDSDDDDEQEKEKDRDNGTTNVVEGNDTDAKPPPLIIHDVLGNGGVGGRMKNGKAEHSDAFEDGNEFRLIDDENTLCLHNDCVHPVKELRKILDVYNSDKNDSAIGENGVGVKQAAAAMSDLSIVITTRIDEEPLLMDYDSLEGCENSAQRIRKCLVSIGVLAKKMQSTEACMIPSWTLPIEFNIDEHNKKKDVQEPKQKDTGNPTSIGLNDDDDDIGEGNFGEAFIGDTCRPVLMRALSKVTADNRLLSKTMREYGLAAAKNRRKYGIQRLAKHIELMVSSSATKKSKRLKPPHPHQFLMILHKFGKHQQANKHAKTGSSDETAIVKARNELDDLLRDLADEMPRTYLHIPPAPHFKVRVNGETLRFQYWERHLVELHQIPLIVDRKNDFRTAEDWLIPANDEDTYEIKVSIGFDPTRANPHGSQNSADNTSNSFIGGQACSLLIFSRISGRLFLKHDDARGVLRLTNSGTNFCQGLTILVDDFEGHLPLTPTKESLAFGMEDYGKIHERNLYAWLGALANVYWTHFHTIYKSKRALGNAVKAKINRVNQLERKESVDLPTLRFGSFSTVEKVCFTRERVRDSIRPYKSELTKWVPGPNTLIKFHEPSSTKPKKKRPSISMSKPKKRSPSDMVLDGYDSDGNDLMEGAPPPSAFESSAPEGNGEVPDQDNNETVPTRSRLDGRPVRATMKPQRFEEIHETPKSRKRRFKPSQEKGNEARLKKRLSDTVAELRETQLELNASRATCDDLQMQLEEVEHAGSEENKTISNLKTELNEVDRKHKVEMQRVKEDHMKQMEELRARLRELEEKN